MPQIPTRSLHPDRLLPQLVLALVAPTILVGLLIGIPLAESRRAALLDQEQRRAVQAAEAAALVFTERLQAGVQLIRMLSNQDMLLPLTDAKQSQIATMVAEARAETPFTCLTLQRVRDAALVQSGTCLVDSGTAPAAGVRFQPVAGEGLIAQISAPIQQHGQELAWIVGELPLDRSLVEAARQQPDLELGVAIDATVVSSSLPDRAGLVVQAQADSTPQEVSLGAARYLSLYAPLRDLSGRQVAEIEVLLPLARVRSAQFNVTLIVLGGTLTAVLVAVVLGWYMARRITHPVTLLGRSAAAIGAGDLSQHAIIQGPTELRQLGAAIDHMRDQLAQSRQALEAEKQRYLDILESITEAVITLDPHERITSLNHGAERMLGWMRSQALGLPLMSVVTPADGSAINLAALVRHGSLRIAARTPLRETLTVSATCAPQPGADGYIVVLRDVSEDAAIQQLKDAFLANITHELRTPLAAQIASLEILREEADALTPTERTQMLDALHSGVQRLDVLVQNLLDSASIEAGYFRVEPEVCRIEPLVDEAVAVLQPLVRQRSQSIQVSMGESLPAVAVDGRRIVQVLVNLLANASKFGPIGDQLQLRVVGTADHYITLSVCDHGPGVAPERQQRLFERFLRPGTGTMRAQGAGLGLAIVKAIVDRHGGQVVLNPSHPTGTTITVRLPVTLRGTYEDSTR